MRPGRLIVVSGPSGVGKTSLLDGLHTLRDFHFSVSATTRRPRPGEQHGVDYYFVDDVEFRRRIEAGELLEWAEYNGRLYGTPAGAIDERLASGSDVLLDIEVQGARQIRATRPDALLVFVAPPSMDVLEARLRGRGDTSDHEIARRLAIAQEEVAAADELFDVVVVNDNLDTAVRQLAGILRRSEETGSP